MRDSEGIAGYRFLDLHPEGTPPYQGEDVHHAVAFTGMMPLYNTLDIGRGRTEARLDSLDLLELDLRQVELESLLIDDRLQVGAEGDLAIGALWQASITRPEGLDDLALPARHLQGVGAGVLAVAIGQVRERQHRPHQNLLVVGALVGQLAVIEHHRAQPAAVIRPGQVIEPVPCQAQIPHGIAGPIEGKGDHPPFEQVEMLVLAIFANQPSQLLMAGLVAPLIEFPADIRPLPPRARHKEEADRKRHARVQVTVHLPSRLFLKTLSISDRPCEPLRKRGNLCPSKYLPARG